MARFSRGRHWNVGLQDRSQLSATDKQLRMLRSLYKKDFRGEGLTVGRASDLIDEGMKARAEDKSGLSSIEDQLFSHYLNKATEAANKAGDAWLAAHPEPEFVIHTADGYLGVHGIVGHVYITAPKKGSGLAKWMREHGFDDRRDTKAMLFQHKFADRPEVELQMACCVAALDVLRVLPEYGDMRVIVHADRQDFKFAA